MLVFWAEILIQLSWIYADHKEIYILQKKNAFNLLYWEYILAELRIFHLKN